MGKKIGSEEKLHPRMKEELTVRLKPSGGPSYQESFGSNRSECNIPGLINFSGDDCGSGMLTPLADASSLASLVRGNIIIPASDTGYFKQTNKERKNN